MKAALIYVALLAAAAALFLLAPGVDLRVSGTFYVPGSGFPLAGWPPLRLLHHEIGWLAAGIAAVVAGAGLWLFLFERPLWRFDRKALVFLVAATVIGPGLLANTVLKDHWGRARPAQIEAFGGARHFTPALLPTRECARNCSFVSGDAALGFALLGFAFLLPAGAARRRGEAAALGVGAAIGLGRIAQGAHFLSDVVFAGFLVYGVTAALWWWIVAHDGLAAPALVRLYARVGRALSAGWSALSRASPAMLATAVTVVAVSVAIAAVDRPLALYLHGSGDDVRRAFERIGRLGLAWGYLSVFALAFVVLHWGGALPRLQPHRAALRALSAVPGFLFATIAAAGIAADLLKVLFGRARPKLLFEADLYGFFWFSLDPRHWSFPSGHATTIAALMTALWWLWPRHLLFYIAVATCVAGARVIAGEHYLGDALAGAFIAVAVTWGAARGFAHAGIDLVAARHGRAGEAAMPPWPCRFFASRLWRRRRV